MSANNTVAPCVPVTRNTRSPTVKDIDAMIAQRQEELAIVKADLKRLRQDLTDRKTKLDKLNAKTASDFHQAEPEELSDEELPHEIPDYVWKELQDTASSLNKTIREYRESRDSYRSTTKQENHANALKPTHSV
ncbi:hypothetical protein EDC01DRAFT_630752 [Geopyxis carbonaria]|nr:hypothetical protein EDC01DRAFT_630752 [Geopyxis carbonaria]